MIPLEQLKTVINTFIAVIFVVIVVSPIMAFAIVITAIAVAPVAIVVIGVIVIGLVCCGIVIIVPPVTMSVTLRATLDTVLCHYNVYAIHNVTFMLYIGWFYILLTKMDTKIPHAIVCVTVVAMISYGPL